MRWLSSRWRGRVTKFHVATILFPRNARKLSTVAKRRRTRHREREREREKEERRKRGENLARLGSFAAAAREQGRNKEKETFINIGIRGPREKKCASL